MTSDTSTSKHVPLLRLLYPTCLKTPPPAGGFAMIGCWLSVKGYWRLCHTLKVPAQSSAKTGFTVFSFWIFPLLQFPHCSEKPKQMKSSMTFMQKVHRDNDNITPEWQHSPECMCHLRNIACDYQESVTTGQTVGRQKLDKVIPMCRYASQATQNGGGLNDFD